MFNLAGGAVASDPAYYGNGGSLGAPAGSYSTGMAAPNAYFTWPEAGSGSKFDPGSAGAADDRLILQGKGTVGFCQIANNQWYGTVIANPTVVIDGANSRIVADVATRYRLSWVRARVAIAELNLTGVTPAVVDNGDGTSTETWTIPSGGGVKMTAGGESVFRLLSVNGYVSGANMNAATIRATYPNG
jgi:hypothetical protein